jgi:uncharacterized protein YchJ
MPAMVRGSAGRRVQRPIVLAAGAVALLCAAGRPVSVVDTFVAPQLASEMRTTVVQRRAGGFSDEAKSGGKAAKPSNRVTLSDEQLKADHGDAWQMVDDVLKGKKASCPEAIMRARFTALRYKDVGFLAATEDDDQPQKQRSDQWAITLGLKEKSFFDSLMRMGGEDIESLAGAKSFKVISAEGDVVDFEITCDNGKKLREKSKFKKDKKWGYIYSGDSEFTQWS